MYTWSCWLFLPLATISGSFGFSGLQDPLMQKAHMIGLLLQQMLAMLQVVLDIKLN